jgi:branched-chain amino acid transport system ATP-binding protein
MKNNSDSFLSVSKLEVVYHHVSTAIQGVSFKISERHIFAIIGSNGAGKTTTLMAISGFLGSDNAEITDGDIYFMGERINGLPPHKITRMGIVLVPERNKIFETLTTEENLLVSSPKSVNKEEAIRKVYDYFPHLYPRRDSLAGFLSGGEKQMLSIGQAILSLPKLLMLDEVSMGLSPLVVTGLYKTLSQMKKELDLTILLVEQNAGSALSMADYVAVMENGRIVFDGPPQKLLAHEDIREFYLGIREGGQRSYREVKQYRRTRRWWG